MTATALDAALRRLEARDEEVRAERRTSRQVVVLSPKGGCGRTTVATNLAVALAQRDGADVALADVSLAFGDVATALLLDPRAGLHRLASAPRPLAAPVVEGALQRHRSGLHVLCAPEDPVAAEPFTKADVVAALDALRTTTGMVVVDTPAGFGDEVLAALEGATDIVLVAALDVATLLGLRQVLDAVELLGFGGARRHVVVNRVGPRTGVELADVEQTLGTPAAVVVPERPEVAASSNEGVPIVLADPGSKAAKPLLALAERLDPPPAAATATPARRWRRARG
jgi:pilus assembly protein CpaE